MSFHPINKLSIALPISHEGLVDSGMLHIIQFITKNIKIAYKLESNLDLQEEEKSHQMLDKGKGHFNPLGLKTKLSLEQYQNPSKNLPVKTKVFFSWTVVLFVN